MVELTNEDDVVALFVAAEGARYLVASIDRPRLRRAGGGACGGEAHRQAGAEPEPGEEAALCVPADGDHVAIIGEQPQAAGLPARPGAGDGARRRRHPAALQDGGLADAKVFRLADGLTWRLGDRTRTETDLRDWLGERAQAGRLPPNGFPRSGRFG